MWTKTVSKVYQDVKKEGVWQLWADVNGWPSWDKELEYCNMEGAFESGTRFILKLKSGPKVKIMLSEVVTNKKFTDYCQFLGAKMVDAHYLEETGEGLRITNTITVSGPLAFLWVRLVAKNIVNSIPAQMDRLVDLARSHHD